MSLVKGATFPLFLDRKNFENFGPGAKIHVKLMGFQGVTRYIVLYLVEFDKLCINVNRKGSFDR